MHSRGVLRNLLLFQADFLIILYVLDSMVYAIVDKLTQVFPRMIRSVNY